MDNTSDGAPSAGRAADDVDLDDDVERIAAAVDAWFAEVAEQGEVEPEVLFARLDAFQAALVANGSDGARRLIERLERWRRQVLGTLD